MLIKKRNTKLFIIFTLVLLLVYSVSFAGVTTLRTHITGVTGPILKNIQERLAISEASYGTTLNPQTINTFYKNAPQNIQKAIEPFGYFHSKVQTALTHTGDVWDVTFVIDQGTPIRVNTVDLKVTGPGKDNLALQKILRDSPVKPGQIFEAESYDKVKQDLFQTANEEGYLKATFDQKVIRIDLKKNTAVIVLHINTGPRYYFGPVTFNQNTFSDKFLKRFLSFHEGEPFSSPKLIKFQQNLSNSNYFQTVNVNPDLQNIERIEVPIDVALTANKAKQYNLGVGYGTFTGARLTFDTKLRHLTKTGHHMDLQLKLSEVLSGLAAQYIIPGPNPLTDQYTIGATAQKFSPKNGNSISKSISFGYVKTIDDWKWSTAFSYLREHYNIVGDPSHNSRIVYPSFEVTHTKADDLINTRFGNKIDFLVRGASLHVVSNVSFAQAEIKGKYIFSPTENSRMILRGDFGYTTVKDLNALPISLQFYAGGLDSVRGFPYSYFGPGRYLKVASLELQHHLYGKISGTADNHLNAPMGRGTGIGLIYQSAIGPIKAYAGFGHLAQKSRHFAFEFSLGPDL
jgi:translocation and assembly module TamA